MTDDQSGMTPMTSAACRECGTEADACCADIGYPCCWVCTVTRVAHMPDQSGPAARMPNYPEPITHADTHPTGCIGCKLDDGPHAWTPPTATKESR